MKFSLKTKIFLWFGIIILVAFILYGTLLYFVFQYNLRGERYFNNLREQPLLEEEFINKMREMDSEHFGRMPIPPGLTILPPGLFTRVFLSITGGVLVIIIISSSGGFLFLRRMLNQVDLITRNVKEIDEKKLHLRINLKGRDPISNMSRTFDSMLDKIENSFKSQKQFVQNVSHELNTPLTVMKTKIDLLRQKKSITGREYRETIDLVDSEIMRLSKITGELLVLSDLEENSYKAEPSDINVKAVIEKILKLYENQVLSKDLKLITDYSGRFDIMGNTVQVEQLIFNLLDNAVKHSTNGSELQISLSNNPQQAELIVEITNVSESIKKKDMCHIFDRFYRTDGINGKKGFGLGLSIAEKIVQKHRGRIEADFDEDKKTVTLRVILPLTEKNK
ncbi:MAG: HAMP domain-containing histidine kinase [Actinobacteria bacterium]|nr:HAMP domain-containing histidine kinase [Actinomycetota bacterium]